MAKNRPSVYQKIRFRQESTANPRLFQAMDLLNMPLHDLTVRLEEELAENPFLELAEADSEEPLEADEQTPEDPEAEFDWEHILLEGFDAGGTRAQYEPTEYFEPTAVEAFDLRDHLREQTGLLRLDLRQSRIAEEIIGNINDAGFLSCPLDAIVQGLNGWLVEPKAMLRDQKEDVLAEVTEEDGEREAGEDSEQFLVPFTSGEVQEVLHVMQSLEPPGICARDLQDCLVIQMKRQDREDSLAGHIVRDCFDDLLNHRWADVARAMEASPKDVQRAYDEIAKLDPRPGRGFSTTPDRYVIPDLIVEYVAGEYMVFVNDTGLPRLRLARSYREVAMDRNQYEGENKEFISNKLNAAKWLIQIIERRRQTMLMVMRFIVDRQQDFFARGVQHLRPMTLQEVARHIEMAESTVSRVANEKYVQTPAGVFPLKYFFSGGLTTVTGENVSTRGVKAQVKALVDKEDPRRPLTDQEITNLLRSEGVRIARRTVAKYRDQMGIVTARMRKRI